MNATAKVETFAGIDVSKTTVDVGIWGETRVVSYGYDTAGIDAVIAELQHYELSCIVVEATSDLEKELVTARSRQGKEGGLDCLHAQNDRHSQCYGS